MSIFFNTKIMTSKTEIIKFPKANVFFDSENTTQINQQLPSKKPEELDSMRGLLNSERIKLIFGDFGVELLLQEGNLRVSNLHSKGVMRTCAVVNYVLPVPAWLENTHNKIYKGSSIGQTIKNDGFDLIKEDSYFGLIQLPKFAKDKMEKDEKSAAVYIYQLVVKNPETSESRFYCTITEVYSPLYLTYGDLCLLSPEGTQKYTVINESVQKHLDDLSNLDEHFNHSCCKL